MVTAVLSNRRPLGILCVTGAMLSFSFQDAAIKWMSGSYPLHEIVLGRSLVAIVLTLFIMHLEGGLALLRTRRWPLHLARGLLLVVANMSYFLALAALPIAEALAIFYVVPLFIVVLSVPVLGERVGLLRWTAVIVGLAGVLVMLRPGTGIIEIAALLPVQAALAYAIMQMITRRLGLTDKASTMAFYVQLTFVAVSATIGLSLGDGRYGKTGDPSFDFLLRTWIPPDALDAILIAMCGVLSEIGAYLLSQAYRVAEAGLLAPFEYTMIPLAIVWGIVLWGDRLDSTATLGIVLIVGSGLFVFYRETLHGRLVAARRPMPRTR